MPFSASYDRTTLILSGFVCLFLSTAAFAVNCDSYGQKVASKLRLLFADNEQSHKCEVTPLSGAEHMSKYPEDAKVPAQEQAAVHDSVPPKSYEQPDPDYEKYVRKGFFRQLSRRAHLLEKQLDMEEEISQRQLACESELAKIKLEHEAVTKNADAGMELFLTVLAHHFEVPIKVQKEP